MQVGKTVGNIWAQENILTAPSQNNPHHSKDDKPSPGIFGSQMSKPATFYVGGGKV